MNLVTYQDKEEYLTLYCQLTSDVYSGYPLVAESKIQEARRTFSCCNPFIRFGRYQNFLLLSGTKAVAHASAFTDSRLAEGVGLVGYFECLSKKEYADKILKAALSYFAKNKISIVWGPVNLNTWRSFRVSYPETNPPYFLEPFTRAYYKESFESCG